MDWKFALFLVGVGNMIVTSVSFVMIKFNDLKHLSQDLNEIKNRQTENTKEINRINTNVEVLTNRIENLEKV